MESTLIQSDGLGKVKPYFSYEVILLKRQANEHSVRAPVFLERCLNDTCLNYLSDVIKERLYDKMLSALGNCTISDDFISRCM